MNKITSEILKKSDTLCLAPWLSIHTWPNGNTYPCCTYDSLDPIGNVNENTLEEIWNNDRYTEIRAQMLNGVKPKGCSRCYKIEETNVKVNSYRQKINKDFIQHADLINHTQPDGYLEAFDLRLWDFRISNFCNLKCRSCGIELSSSWHSDSIELGYTNVPEKALISVTERKDFLSQIQPNYDKVEEIYFAGGEPLIMPEHYQMLDELIKTGNTSCRLRYSTNFTKLKFGKKSVIDYWKLFPNKQIFISLDGIGKTGEYVRKGLNTEQLYKNIHEYYESGLFIRDLNSETHNSRELYINSGLGIMVTYGTLNFLHLFDTILDLHRNNIVSNCQGAPMRVWFSPIMYPLCYDAGRLPNNIKNQFFNRLNTFESELEEQGIHPYVIEDTLEKLKEVYNTSTTRGYDEEEMQNLIEITKSLDKIRKESFEECLGQYYSSPKVFIDNSENLISKL